MPKYNTLHFNVVAKSILDINTLDLNSQDVTKKVRPRGDFYFFRRNTQIRPDDWIIYGVASTNNVDLENEIIDAKYVFEDSLEEFVNTGRIFWEHGYKLAGTANPETMIDIALGIPYMAEIFENELSVYVILDKTHPQAKKLWDKANASDERFRNQIGLSIGALPQGKPTLTIDPKTGTKITKAPKMKLYEISATGQPVNQYTWTEVIKSFLHANQQEEEMAKTDQKTKALDEDKTKDTKPKEIQKPTEKPEKPENNKEEKENVVENTDNQNAKDMTGSDVEAEEMENTDNTDKNNEPTEPTEDEGNVEIEGAGDVDENSDDENTDNAGGLEDLMGALGTDDSGKGESGGSGSDASIGLVLDKMEMLVSQVAELSEKLNQMSGTIPSPVDGNETENKTMLPPTDDKNSQPIQLEQESPMSTVQKSLNQTLDKNDYIISLLNTVNEKFDGVTLQLKSITQRVNSLETTVTSSTNTLKKDATNQIDEARKNYSSTQQTTKSINSKEVTKGLVTSVNGQHPQIKDYTETKSNLDGVLKSIKEDENKKELLIELVTKYKSIKGNPYQVASQKDKIFNTAKEIFNLDKSDFRELSELSE